jgi:hypothetical protein
LSDRSVSVIHDKMIEFSLSNKENIYQLAVIQFNVGQHPDLFEQFMIQPLGFINNQQYRFIGDIRFKQKLFEFDQKIAFADENLIHLKFIRKEIKKVHDFQIRIRNGGNERLNLGYPDKGVYQKCFPGADIAGKNQKSLLFHDPVFQGGKGLLVFFTEPEESGIGADVKWLFF